MHVSDSPQVLVYHNVVAQQVFALEDAVAEFDDQLQVSHYFRELQHKLGCNLVLHFRDMQLVSLQPLQDVEYLVLLRPDLVVDLPRAIIVHFPDSRDA